MTQIGNSTGCREFCPKDAFNFKQRMSSHEKQVQVMPCVKCRCASSCSSCNWQCDTCMSCI